MDLSFDYLSPLDRPDIINLVFYPRPDIGNGPPQNSMDHLIQVEEGIHVGMRLYLTGKDRPNILFFHGNGEIAADYDDIGPVYNRYETNFLVADYRGYGKSNGDPSGIAMMRDAHAIFHDITTWLEQNGYKSPLFLMGRSLGSASALELAASYQDRVKGLILESAFAHTLPLLKLLGIPVEQMGVTEMNGFGNDRKIEKFHKPTLIIHAQYDHIIPFEQAEVLMERSPARGKQLIVVPGADHNDILYRGGEEYFRTIYYFVKRLCRPSK